MNMRTFIVVLCMIVIAGFGLQPLLAQEESCCESMQEAACAGCAGHKQEKVVDKAETPNQTKCPVMGGPIDEEAYADYDGKRIHFCCAGCEKSFLEEPEKYMKQMKEQGMILDDALCPVSGKPANPDLFTKHDGKKVYFCCEDCKTKYLKSPEKHLKKG
jgi:YHS domain-containing protein